MINSTLPWKNLIAHQKQFQKKTLQQLFSENSHRAQQFTFTAPELMVDFSKNHITEETLRLLIDLANEAKLSDFIKAMFTGEKINTTENRAALHTALRNRSNTPVFLDRIDVMPKILASLDKMKQFCDHVHSQQLLGYTDNPIRHIVNIGIGGSDLGPQLVVKALHAYRNKNIQSHFIANVDPRDLLETLEELNPETTLFIVASKTFTSTETLTNAKAAREWLLAAMPIEEAIAKHFVAVTAHPKGAIAFGIDPNNIFELWDWVGGRYSLWSAIGLPIALSIGFDRFVELLEGAYAMDQHFRETPFEKNVPVLLGLVGLWYRNFFNTASHAIIPYSQSLQWLPSYLQQLDMESNGKRVTRDGELVDYATGPVIWGSCGTNGQHAFHQLLHQGTDIIPIDFIVARENLYSINNQHPMLYANCLAQSEALLLGKQTPESYRTMPGNRPSTTILTQKLAPRSLGTLIALYEHKVFVQGIVWGLNSFDQWGVELGKTLAKTLLPELIGQLPVSKHDSSTQALLHYYTAANARVSQAKSN